MSVPGSRPANPAAASASLNLRGAVDLSSLKTPRTPASAPAAGEAPGGSGPVEVTEQNFPDLVQLSNRVPVVMNLWAPVSPQSSQLTDVLQKVADENPGRILVGSVDAQAFPQIAQAFQAQSVPTVVAVLKGQPVPLFQGPVPEEQIRSFFAELLKVAEANGVSGTLDEAPAGGEEQPAPLPPLHQDAYDAIEAGDWAGAAEAYRKALAEQPADADAKAGLAQVQLMQRVEQVSAQDAAALRTAAAEQPDDLQTQLSVADLDLVGGHVEDALDRLVGFIARNFGPERETVRLRLLELFDVVGGSDPRVAKARAALARALF
ncbi:tetratricopeptide repeat protein [Paenarthrobacter sp. DKR-5]|uniref:tetratricopeptide repeat protein n=1 Tax=Paenarthrobacter sp. DKR-5 TaxID=2835535 RepID=UPI001BDC78A6|nr:tetratricopeptide repeat protein [Paenarthrobacter sp. DKR-5]MBT1003136.1 tetratricopeptide repeat protein [Paenarthrobacter sp. DKR-5]